MGFGLGSGTGRRAWWSIISFLALAPQGEFEILALVERVFVLGAWGSSLDVRGRAVGGFLTLLLRMVEDEEEAAEVKFDVDEADLGLCLS